MTLQDDIAAGQHNYGSLSLRDMHATSGYRVPLVTLDQLASDGYFGEDVLSSACPHFIKMDIETHELLAMIGGVDILKRCTPLLLFESNAAPLWRSQILLLDSLGYSLAWVIVPVLSPGVNHFGRSPVVERDIDGIISMIAGGGPKCQYSIGSRIAISESESINTNSVTAKLQTCITCKNHSVPCFCFHNNPCTCGSVIGIDQNDLSPVVRAIGYNYGVARSG